MSGSLAHADDEKEKIHVAVQGRQDQVHPSEDSLLNSAEDSIPADGRDEIRTTFMQDGSTKGGEKRLRNGDLYVGSWNGTLPDGTGKYLWSNGCMYEGEWGRGKKTGRGKISWPSGATYEGDFLGGNMHGTGTFTGVDGRTYKGDWRMNVKHGLGRQRYANGDVYQGSWNQGAQDGPGRYVWANGNLYWGNWKGGAMCGRGTLTWASGDSYHGQWLDGLEHGHGKYSWADGGCYVGIWSRGLKDGKGIFYPAGTKPPGNGSLQHGLLSGSGDEAAGKYSFQRLSRASSSEAEQLTLRPSRRSNRASSSEKISTGVFLRKSESLPSRTVVLERRWSLEGAFEKILGLDTSNASLVAGEPIWEDNEKDLGDPTLPIVEREYAQGVLISELVKDNFLSLSSRATRRRQRRQAKEIKRPGETIIKGHRSYDLMLNLQLGIRYTVGKITPEPNREIVPSDFGPRARIWMKFPREGSQRTPPHQSVDFRWKDYCPMVFRNLREMFKIDAADYMMSICGNDALRELSSPGKSGSIFFLSNDDRFMIKTLRKPEVKVLLRMLPNYYYHVHQFENTLITKFFGLHRVKLAGGQKVRFVVMGNMLCTELRIHRRFDLKGSSLGRSADKVEIDETTTLKDLDLDFVFHLEPSWREVLLKQIEVDCNFLESQRIMDYSLLLGLHFRAPQYPRVSVGQPLPEGVEAQNDNAMIVNEDQTYPRGLVLVAHEPKEGSSVGPHVRGGPLRVAAAGDEEVDLLLPGTARLRVQLGVNMPARADRRPCNTDPDTIQEDEIFGETYDVVLYLGIIDILQEYNIAKKIEHAYKALQFDSVSISAVDPQLYSQRFQEFIRKTFPDNLL